ncbi:MAG: 2-succinylbenzoate--CoA ligase [Elainellaceae cyanobacterium]
MVPQFSGDFYQDLLTDWLIGDRGERLAIAYAQRADHLSRCAAPTVLIAEADPVRFLAGFFAASAAGCPIALGNPHWGRWERRQAVDLIRPDIVWAEADWVDSPAANSAREQKLPSQRPAPGWILVPTGGSSGRLRFVIHTWETLRASVAGFCQHFQVERVRSLCVLPLYHVSGLMQAMRCLLSGGQLAVMPFKTLLAAPDLPIDPADCFLSLVPTQLQRLLESPGRSLLPQFRTVLLGGAPPWTDLLEQGRSLQIPLAVTYGMTETASQIATLPPDLFLAGDTSAGPALPHARITIRDAQRRCLAPYQVGQVTIQADSLALGYYPTPRFDPQRGFQPDDQGFLDEHGHLHLVGRSSDKIITGGENVFPAEVEAAIRRTGLVEDVAVIGVGDRHWGQAVTALYVPRDRHVTGEAIARQLTPELSAYKRPKHWIALTELPRNSQGKLNRPQLQTIAQSHLRPSAPSADI